MKLALHPHGLMSDKHSDIVPRAGFKPALILLLYPVASAKMVDLTCLCTHHNVSIVKH